MSEPIVGLGGNRLILDEGHPPDDETRIEVFDPTGETIGVVFDRAAALQAAALLDNGARSNMAVNADLLGSCWRGGWNGFDGRQLEEQLWCLDMPPTLFADSIDACIECQGWLDDCPGHNTHQIVDNVHQEEETTT